MTLRRLTQTGVARLSASFCSLKEALPFYRMERFQTIPFSDEMYCISKLQIETESKRKRFTKSLASIAKEEIAFTS